MGRLLRIEYRGGLYHLTARGNARQLIFKDEQDHCLFGGIPGAKTINLVESSRIAGAFREACLCRLPEKPAMPSEASANVGKYAARCH
jgi:hypothetical protein